MEDVGDGPEAAGRHAARARVAAVHGPEHEVALVRVQLQKQHHGLAAQLVDLDEEEEEDPADAVRQQVFTSSKPTGF